jgi:antitoxin VapB
MLGGSENSKRARVFRNGGNQAVRIPRDFEFDVDEVVVRKVGRALIIEPALPLSLHRLLDTLEPLDERLDPVDELPLEDVDL